MRQLTALALAALTTTAAYAQDPVSQLRQGNRNSQDQNRQTATAREDGSGTGSGSQSSREGTAGSHKMNRAGVDREAAIGHALGMAIEGSSLWHCAQKAQAMQAMADRNSGNNQAMRDPRTVLEQHARDSFRASERLFQAVMQDERSNQGNTGRNGASGANSRNQGQQGQAGNSSQQGGDHMARHQACEEFYRAARDYSRALETACSNTRQAGAQGSSNSGQPGAQASSNAGQAGGAQASSSTPSGSGGQDVAKIALINHAVKEAVEGVALHQMLRHHGERDRTTQALESHAEQMIASSRHAIDSIDQGSANSGQSRNGSRQLNNAQASNTNAQGGNNASLIGNANNRANNQNNAQARGNEQARNDQGTVRRDAARPTYNDERQHSNLNAGEAITVQQLAKLGREVIRSVDQLNQKQDQMKK